MKNKGGDLGCDQDSEHEGIIEDLRYTRDGLSITSANSSGVVKR